MSDNNVNASGAPSECRFRLASVYILNAPFHLDKTFDYLVARDTEIEEGYLVAVPFGGGNRPETALVKAVHPLDADAELKNYKPIGEVLSPTLALNSEALAMVDFLKERTFCTTGEALRAITPSAAFSRLRESVSCALPLPEYYADGTREQLIYAYIYENISCTKQDVLQKFGQRALKSLNALISCGALACDITAQDATNIKVVYFYETPFNESQIVDLFEKKLLRSKNHRQILEFLCERGICEQSEIISALGVTAAQIRALAEKGYVKCTERERYRIPYSAKKSDKAVILNEAQLCAVDKIISLINSDKPQAALLHGVTGSGKTQVMRAVMENVISRGRSVILLVPEISLTPQTIAFFSASFGERTAVIHSGLSAGERFDAWRRIKKGEVDICIGTRSAIFAPFENLGLIIIDEEQEHTYKSDQSPKYSAKDVAAFRCAKHNCTLLLASATPSIESYHKAVTGVYTLCELPGRYGSGGIPKAEIVDMRSEAKDGNFSLFSTRLLDSIKETLEGGKQSILFLNRRGYHSFLSCPTCGEVFMCPHCSVSLTQHRSRFKENGYLLCHYCGYKSRIPEKCPKCESTKLRYMGFGTQLAEEQLKKIFPSAEILRMDADTTTGKFSYDEILNKFRNKEADILLGTQMVTKGHDFPNVTLVGLLSAEQSLYVDDYRANERTFSLICQTVGRAGRRDEQGTALIQCYNPEHNVLALSSMQDYRAFYENEISMRRALLFPPFCDIVTLTVTSNRETDTFNAANMLLDKLKELTATAFSDVKLQIFGPFEAPVYKLNEKFRVRLVIKTKSNKKSRALFRAAMNYFYQSMPKTISVGIDINPTSL